MTDGIGYENDICYFCGKNEAGYARVAKGKIYDACHKCAKKATLTEPVNEESKTKQIGQASKASEGKGGRAGEGVQADAETTVAA